MTSKEANLIKTELRLGDTAMIGLNVLAAFGMAACLTTLSSPDILTVAVPGLLLVDAAYLSDRINQHRVLRQFDSAQPA